MGIFVKGEETIWRNADIASVVRTYVLSNPGKTIYEIASACNLLPEQAEWAVRTLDLLMYTSCKNNAYHKQFGLANTNATAVESTHIYLRFGVMYVEAQNCYVGDSEEQAFLLQAASPCEMSRALPLVNTDLSSLFTKATQSGTIVHVIGSTM